MATAVKEDTFTQEVLQSDKPVIVDFWVKVSSFTAVAIRAFPFTG